MADKLPGARAALVDNAGVTTPPFYRYFQTLERLQAGTASAADVAAINEQIAAINAEIAALPKSSFPTLQVSAPLTSAGLLQNGFAKIGLAALDDSGTGTFKLITRDSFGRVSGTKAGTTSDVPEGTNLYYTDARVDARLSPGYIDGLQMQWVSGTAVTVSSGAAYIPGLGRYLQSNAAIALSGLTLTASTWYHLYLYSNAGTPAVECVTTAPVLYYGTAYQKTGDNTRRYIGSVLSDSGGHVYNFAQQECRINNLVPSDAAPFRCLNAGQATVLTNVSLAGAVPITSRSAQVRVQNTDTGNPIRLSNSLVQSGTIIPVQASSAVAVDFPLDASQALQYQYFVSPSGWTFIDVMGYVFKR